MEISTFFDKKQELLNSLAINVHIEFNSFTKNLDLVGGVTITSTVSGCYRVKDSIIALLMTYEKYRSTHSFVVWEGQEVPISVLIHMLMEVLNKLEETSDFKIVQNHNL